MAISREIETSEGVRWTCAQAYAGLAEPGGAAEDAARKNGSGGLRVVCTPSGGRQSVALELSEGWEQSLSDEDLLDAIREQED